MTAKKKILMALGLLLVIAVTAGLTGLATSTYGSETDPLVTQSYIDQVVIPAITAEINTKIAEKSAQLADEFSAQLDALEQNTPSTVPEDQSFVVISLKQGQTVTCAVGTEIMPRIGTVKSHGPDNPRLVDETTGKTVPEAGTTLEKNHMYMVTIKNNGFKAATDAKVLIRGEYTISG